MNTSETTEPHTSSQETFDTLVQLLGSRASTLQENLAYVILDRDGEPVHHLSYRDLDRSARRAAMALARRATPGTPVALFCDDLLVFVKRFWALLYAGLVPVPLPAPRNPRDRSSLERLRGVVEDASIRLVLGDDEHRERVLARGPAWTGNIEWLSDPPSLTASTAIDWHPPALAPRPSSSSLPARRRPRGAPSSPTAACWRMSP